MCISKFFALFRKAKAQPEQPQPKADPKHHPIAPGKYFPHAEWVRVDNITKAAGVTPADVRNAANDMGMMVREFTMKRGHYLSTKEAVIIHTKLAGK